MTDQGGMNVKPYDALLWQQWRESIGLNESQWENLTRLVGLHMVLDRMLTLRLLTALCGLSAIRSGTVEKLASTVAEISFGRRLALAKDSGLLSDESASDLTEVNRVRNSLLHFRPRSKEGFSGIPEINSPESLRTLVQSAVRVFGALTKDLLPLFEAAAKED